MTQSTYKHHMSHPIEHVMGRSRYLHDNASKFLKTEHFLIHYLQNGCGEPLILVHGGGMWLYSFRHSFGPLSKSASVYALDMPGYGYTCIPDPTLIMDLNAMSLAIKEFMDGLNIQKATLVGHSWGGGWALAYALSYPERVNHIVLIDSSGLDIPDVMEWELLKMPVVGDILLRLLTPGLIRRRLEHSFYRKGTVDDDMAYEVYLPMKIPANRKAQAMLARNLSWAPVESCLDKLNHPVLLIWGEQDRYLDVTLVKRFEKKIKNLTVEIISNCGHSAHEEAPDIVNRFILEFLQGK
jgi:pimeloyl-ACP methyl ester carboxylesterase